uniref:Uncharacterized protein n=1 Tax=Octopus bimaculoides TaxID=37653 RepID=A0A0L8GMW9_OCTBM
MLLLPEIIKLFSYFQGPFKLCGYKLITIQFGLLVRKSILRTRCIKVNAKNMNTPVHFKCFI